MYVENIVFLVLCVLVWLFCELVVCVMGIDRYGRRLGGGFFDFGICLIFCVFFLG